MGNFWLQDWLLVYQRQVRLSSGAVEMAALVVLVVLEGGGVVDLESALLLLLDPEEGFCSGTGGDMAPIRSETATRTLR